MLFHSLKSRFGAGSVASAFGLLYNVPSSRSASYYMLRSPPASSPRELATPLVFLSSKAWDETSNKGMRTFASSFAERGYTTLEIDLGLPTDSVEAKSSEALLHHFEAELASHVRLAAIPFPPVIFARSGGTLIAQTYISSNPASGLVLIAPPTSTSSPSATRILPTPLSEYDYEPRFPLLVLDTPSGMEQQVSENRLIRGNGVDHIALDELEGPDAQIAMEKWMDSVGV